MENPIDHSIDLGLVNYTRHPSNPNYIVYRFVDLQRAMSFEQELVQASIWFEKDELEKKGKHYTLFGVHKSDYKKTEKINYSVEAIHKKPFIPFKFLRYSVLLIGLGLLLLAILGYCNAQKELSKINDKDISSNSFTFNTYFNVIYM